MKQLTNYGQLNCECVHCQTRRTNKSKNIISHGPWKLHDQLDKDELNRVLLPGDVDYASDKRGAGTV